MDLKTELKQLLAKALEIIDMLGDDADPAYDSNAEDNISEYLNKLEKL
jgi:hypothetical protein